MNQTTTAPLTVKDIGASLYRHRSKAVIFFVLTMALVSGFIVLCPRTYESEGKFFVHVGRQNVTLDPTATTGETVAIERSLENDINSVLEILQSRSMIERVVDMLGPDMILGRTPAPVEKNVPTIRQAGFVSLPIGLDTVSDREKAIHLLMDKVEVYAATKSCVVTIKCTASSPQLAQKIVATLMDVFPAEHVRLNRTAGSRAFFEEQVTLLQTNLTHARTELCDAKNNAGLVSIEAQRTLLENQTSQVLTQIVDTKSALAESEGKLRALRETLGKIPERLMTDEVTGHPASALGDMRNKLYELQVKESELLAKYTEEHPLVLAVRREVAEARKILTLENPNPKQATTTVNPVHQQLELNLLGEQSASLSLKSKLESLQQQRVRIEAERKNLNNVEARIDQLQTKVDLLTANYRTYSEKLEQVRVDQALEADRISNVNIAQAPTMIEKAVNPKKQLIFGAGLMVAMLGGMGLAVMIDGFAPMVRRNSTLPAPKA